MIEIKNSLGTVLKIVEADTLSGADLCGASLRGADLCRADLCRADLSGADLCRANLYGANLYGADLCGASLRGADLRGAYLRGAYLCGADLSGAKYDTHVMRGELTQIDCSEWGGFFAYIEESGGLRIVCGCRHFSYSEAAAHWEGKENRKMTRAALQMAKFWYDAIVESSVKRKTKNDK